MALPVLYRSFVEKKTFNFGLILKTSLLNVSPRLSRHLMDLGFEVESTGCVVRYNDISALDVILTRIPISTITGIMLYDDTYGSLSVYKSALKKINGQLFDYPPPPGYLDYLFQHTEYKFLISKNEKFYGDDPKWIHDYVMRMQDAEFCLMSLSLPDNVSMVEIKGHDFRVQLSDFVDSESKFYDPARFIIAQTFSHSS